MEGNLSRNLKELRILSYQTSPASSSTRSFVEKNYKDLKKLNPRFPILIHDCSGTEPQLWARYAGKSGFGSLLSLCHSSGNTDRVYMKGPRGRREVEVAVFGVLDPKANGINTNDVVQSNLVKSGQISINVFYPCGSKKRYKR